MSKLSLTPVNSNDNTKSMQYCPYLDLSQVKNGTYPTLTKGLIMPEKRAFNDDSSIPESAPNGGLYNAPQVTAPWGSIPVIPSDTNLIHYNLRSAHPPAGATEQYVSTDRLGNNYAPMINVYWYNPDNAKGLYRMAVTKKSDAKEY
jgi:hypothetical protein